MGQAQLAGLGSPQGTTAGAATFMYEQFVGGPPEDEASPKAFVSSFRQSPVGCQPEDLPSPKPAQTTARSLSVRMSWVETWDD